MPSYRDLWRLLTPATVAICSAFGAHALANVLSEQAFPESSLAAQPTIVPRTKREEPVARSKDPAALLARNMFCNDCTPFADDVPSADPTGTRTQLPLRLIATNISKRESASFASVLNTESLRQGAYSIGEKIPEAGVVEAIGLDYLDFAPLNGSGLERVNFDTGAVKASLPQRRAAGTHKPSSLAEEYVRVVSDTHFEVDRALVRKLQGNPLLSGARARPVQKGGVMTGVRLFAVKGTGLAHAMGLRNGDTVLAANGVELKSAEAALELLGQLRTKDHWSIEIERRGKPVRLQVDLQ